MVIKKLDALKYGEEVMNIRSSSRNLLDALSVER